MSRIERRADGVRARLARCVAAMAAAAVMLGAAGGPALANQAQGAVRASPSTMVGPLINAQRQALGLRPLEGDARLTAAAYRHAADMAQRGFFSHAGSDGRLHGQRIAAQGYRACLAAETIAWGQRSAQEVVHGWMNSPGHRRILLHQRATAFGAGFHPERRQWVVVVARPC